MPDVMPLCDRLFPEGHDVRAEGDLLRGTGASSHGPVAVVGTRNRAGIGVDLAFALATEVLQIVERFPKRPILMLVDTQGQQLSRRDELLGNGGYLAHLAKCFEIARLQGHLLLSLVYGEAVSGGYLSLGMIADRAYALADAQIRVMALPAMSRITQIPIEDLQELCRTSAIFGPGVDNYQRLGAVEDVWAGDLASSLAQALRTPAGSDRRAQLGAARGGRVHAERVIAAVLAAP
ncbi:MAG: biotin-independent malonate decarboxylase subunit gamma [Methylibium sp.]|nr:biotin-independent malonate decarboxylase subunit gamma [Methylibium sp.]